MAFPNEGLLVKLTDKLMSLKSEADFISLTKAEGLHAHYYQIKTLICAIEGNFRMHAVRDPQQLLVSMNALELNMEEFVISYYMFYKQNYTLYDCCNFPDHCNSLENSLNFCWFWFWCSKKIHVDTSFQSIFIVDLLDSYSKIVTWYSTISGDHNIKMSYDILRMHFAADAINTDRNKFEFEIYQKYIQNDKKEEKLKSYQKSAMIQAYAVFDDIEFYIRPKIVFNISNKKDNLRIVKFDLLKDDESCILKLMEFQDRILDSRIEINQLLPICIEFNTKEELFVLKFSEDKVFHFKETDTIPCTCDPNFLKLNNCNCGYNDVSNYFPRKFDIELIRLRFRLFDQSYNKSNENLSVTSRTFKCKF